MDNNIENESTLRVGLDKFMKGIENETYSFGGHEQAEKDYGIIMYLRKRLPDFDLYAEDILRELHDYGCPDEITDELKCEEWCHRAGKEYPCRICMEHWKEYLYTLGGNDNDA